MQSLVFANENEAGGILDATINDSGLQGRRRHYNSAARKSCRRKRDYAHTLYYFMSANQLKILQSSHRIFGNRKNNAFLSGGVSAAYILRV
jgi:hypothetical protein